MKINRSILKGLFLATPIFSVPVWVWFCLLPAFILRLWVAWAPVIESFAFSVPDDSYYYFKIAQNIALGNGVTFDGFTATNGFHPLWMMLISPLWWAFGKDNLVLPVHLALTLGALIDILTVIGIWNLAKILLKWRFVGIGVVLAYYWNPFNAAAVVNGLETSVATAFFVWALAAWWRIRLIPTPARRDWFILGLLWALLLLARTDYLVILFPCAIDLVWRFRKLWRSAWPILIGTVVWVPWMCWNIAECETFSQVSGNAYPYYLHTIWQAGAHSLIDWFLQEARMGYGIFVNLARFSGFDKGIIPLLMVIVWFVVTLFLQLRRKSALAGDRDSWLHVSGLIWPTLGAAGLLLYHGLVRWMYLPWYFVPASILLVLWFGVLLERLAVKHLNWVVVLGCVYLGFQVFYSGVLGVGGGMWASQRHEIDRVMPAYLSFCQEHSILGITDSGYAGYYLPCKVVNLDGVVNNDAYNAIVRGEFRKYLDQAKVEHVVLNGIIRQVVEMREGRVPQEPPFAAH